MLKSPNKVIQDIAYETLAEAQTAIPAIVRTYDSVTQTASVQVAVKRPIRGAKVLTPRIIPNVPVMFPSGTGWVIGAPLQEGDGVLLIFTMYDIANYLVGSPDIVSEPTGYSFHNGRTCYAIAGTTTLNSPKVSQTHGDKLHIVSELGAVIQTGTTEIETTTNGATVSIGGTKVLTVTPTGIDVIGTITSTVDVLAGATSLKGHIHTDSMGGATTPPVVF